MLDLVEGGFGAEGVVVAELLKGYAEAFNKVVEYQTPTKSINYVDSITINDASLF